VIPTDLDKPSSQSSSSAQKIQDHQKKIEVGRLNGWGKFDQVEEMQVGGLFGGARMTGSPLIDKDGSIHEGRKPKLSHLALTRSNDAASPQSNNNPSAEDNSSSSVSLLTKKTGNKRPSAAVDDGHSYPQNVDTEEEDVAEQKNEIRKTQFGGAGWIRGKPRLRVADHTNGPQFNSDDNAPAGPSAPPESVAPPLADSQQDEEAYLLQGLDSSLVLDKPPVSHSQPTNDLPLHLLPQLPPDAPLVQQDPIDQQILLPAS